ncbi:YgbJ [Klebsiella pneumoniae]|nr:YgbJ [Klebsiella pneumoniae]
MAAHTNVCVIGLGSMGMGAARACLQAGLNTWGVDINPDNCRALLAAGANGAGPSARSDGACRPRRDPTRNDV